MKTRLEARAQELCSSVDYDGHKFKFTWLFDEGNSKLLGSTRQRERTFLDCSVVKDLAEAKAIQTWVTDKLKIDATKFGVVSVHGYVGTPSTFQIRLKIDVLKASPEFKAIFKENEKRSIFTRGVDDEEKQNARTPAPAAAAGAGAKR
jgi:hypothetical protein